MSHRNQNPLPSDRDPVAAKLLAHRASPEPLELDRLKRRILARRPSRSRHRLRTRIAAVLMAFGLLAGSGGALAVASSGSQGSATAAQYCSKPSGCKKKHHHKKHHKKHHHKKHHKKHHHKKHHHH